MDYLWDCDKRRDDDDGVIYEEGESVHREDAARLIDASDCLDGRGVARRDIYPHDFEEG